MQRVCRWVGGVRLRSLALALALLVTGCGTRHCVLREAERQGVGTSRIDCSHADVVDTGKTCQGMKLYSVENCRTDDGRREGVMVLIDERSCFGRSPAGACYE